MLPWDITLIKKDLVMLKRLIKNMPKLVAAAALFVVGAGLVLKGPQFHGNYIRDKVGSQVVMILDKEGMGGGTGFAVKAPSGKSYVITNAHVCAIGIETGIVYAKSDTGRPIPLKILERSNQSDLCVLEGLARLTGLTIASGVDLGEELGIVGHPQLMPLTLTRGQLIGYANVAVMVDVGPCEKDEGMYRTVMSMFGPVCIEINHSGLTTIPALGGNSGSPVVNFWGNIVGVLYAGDPSNNWGIILPGQALIELLKEY
jgi:S1-C subfamily serine protease